MQNMTTYKLQIKNYTKVEVIPIQIDIIQCQLITIKYKRENVQYTNWNITLESFTYRVELTILKLFLVDLAILFNNFFKQ